MKQQLLVMATIAVCVWSVPAATLAGTTSYTPPPKKGIIYIVCQFKPYKTGDMYPKSRVSVKWGSYSRSSSYGRGAFSVQLKVGFVIALRHNSDDQVRMEIECEGPINLVRQLDSPPSQWNDSKYDKYNW